MYSVGQAKKEIKNSIKAYLRKNKNNEYVMDEVNRLPFYLEGEPGIGKTQLAEQIADELGVGFVSLSITHHTRNTLLGLPMICSGNDVEGQEVKYTEYTMSEVLALVEQEVKKGHKEGILLIDEFACMAESLVAPMLAFLQQKNIGNHRLPTGWVIILCSNPPKYNKSARTFDIAIMDRVRKMEIVFDGKEFLDYGRKKGFHKAILEYLQHNKADIHYCEPGTKNGESIIVTTRGWENLSHCLTAYEELEQEVSFELIYQFIKSKDIAEKFFRAYQIYYAGLTLEEIYDVLEGRNLESYAERVKEKPYLVKWNVIKILEKILSEECAEYAKEETGLLDMREKLKKMKSENELPEKEVLTQQMEHKDADLKEKEEKSNIRIENACRFVEGIDRGENLQDVFINTINQNMGILDVLIRCKNKTYLKNCEKVYGTRFY